MKKTFALPVIIAALAALLALSTHASANGFPTIYWLGSNGTEWTAADNWSSNSSVTAPVSFSSNAYIVFSATTSSNETFSDLSGNQTISSLTINTTGSVPVGISGGNLTINGTTAQAITVEAGNLTISAPLILTGSATTITANQSTSLATITAANGLVFDGTSSASIGAITANGLLQKLGSGITTLTGNNTYTGNTTISEGTLALTENGTLGNSTVIISGGTLDMGGKSLTNTLGNLTAGTLANGTLTNNGSSFNLQNGTISATLAGTNGVNKTTSGTVTLSGSNTYNGTTYINAGTLQIGNDSGFGSGGNITFGGGTLQYGSGIDSDVSSRIKNSASSIRIDTNGNDVYFWASINATNSGGLTKLGNGTLSLNGNNTYTGGTFIASGTLTGDWDGLKGSITNNATLLLSGGSIVIEVDGSGVLLVDGSTRLLGNATMNGGTTIQSGTLTIGGRASNSSPYIAGSIPGDITNNGRLDFDLSPSSGIRTYSGVISGNGSLGTSAYDSSPTGTISLTGNNTYTGGTFVSVGTLDISGGTLASSGNVTITGGSFNIGASNQTIGRFQINGAQSTLAVGSGTLTATNGYDLRQGTVSLSLAGAADIYKNSYGSANNSYDNGIAYLSANNTAYGNITISGGILSFNTVQSLYSGNSSSWTKEKISVGANSTLALGTGNGSAASGFNNAQIAEIFSNLTQNDTVTSGLAANSKIGFNTTSNFTLTTNITDRPDGGAIGVDKIGGSTLTLNSTNTFTGALSIFEGVVALGRTNALRADSDLVVDSKSSSSYGFDVGTYNQQFKDVTLKEGLIAGSSGSVIATGNYTMIKGNATANLSGNASLIKTNTGGSSYNVSEPEIVFLSGTNTYTGRTIVDGVAWTGSQSPSPSSNPGAPTSQNAKLQFQTVGSLYGGNVTLWNPDNISVDSYGIFSLRTGSAGFNGTQVSTIIQNLITANRSGTSGGFLDKSVLGIDTNGEDLVINDNIGDTTGLAIGGGAVGLIKYGNGTLTLNGNSTRSFSTSVTGGNLVLGANANLSSASGNLLVDTATLNIATTNQTVRKVTVTNGSIIGSGTLTSSAGGFVFGGANVTVNLSGAVGATIDSSPGATTLWGNNTYNGTTTVGSTATLSLENVNALAGSTLNYNSNTATLQFSVGGTNTYNFGGLEGGGNITIGGNSLSIGANSQNTSYSGVLSGSGSVTKVGNGTLTLSNNNTYTGGTAISAGTLSIGSGGSSGSVAGDITNNANLVFNRWNNATYADVISGSGNVTKSGSGTLTLSGANSYTGSTTVSGGMLDLNGSLASTSVAISSGATLLNQNSGLSSSSSVVNAGTFTINASETVGSLSGSGNTVLNAALTTGGLGAVDEISGNITGNASLTKIGTGNLTLTGAATNSGGLLISNGIVSIGNGGTTGSATGNITNNAALAFNRSNNSTYSGIISGTGTLEKLGNGTLTLTGNNSATGATTITTGTLQLGNGGTSGSVAGAIVNNGALAINRSDDLAFNYSISGTGSVVKLGNNTLTYNSTVTPTGGTFVNAGTLVVSGTTSAVTINANGTLAGNGTVGNVVINSGGTIAPGNSPGTLTAGNMTWNGGGIYNWQLGNANGTAGTDWDFINSSGSLTIGANSTNRFIIAASTNNSSGFDPNEKFKSWTIANFANGISGFSSDAFTINATGFQNLPAAYLFGVSLTNNSTALNFTYSTIATWTAGTGNWSNASNWDQSFIPIDGVAVEYAGTNGTSTNDSTVGEIYSLTFTEANAGAFTLAGGNLTIGEGGIVNNSNSTQTIAVNLALGANQTFAANMANLVVSGNISGNASLTKAGNQTLTLTGSNTYNGTTISAGTLVLASGGSISNAGGNFVVGDVSGDNGTLTINGGNVLNNAGFLAYDNGSTGVVNVSGGNWTNTDRLRLGRYGNGTLNLTGGDVIIGAGGAGNLTVAVYSNSTGTLNIGTGTTVGTLQAARVTGVNGTAVVNFNHTVTNHIFSPILEGNLAVNKLGNGTTALTGNNSYTQGTVITAGTLAAQSASALGTGNVSLNGGALLVTSSQEAVMGNQTLSIGGNLDWTNGRIAYYDTGASPEAGDLTIRVAGNFTASVGNKTFDFSGVEALNYGAYTLVNATTVSAIGTSFVAAHGPYTTLYGNFTTTNSTIVYTVTGAVSGGTDIRNNGGPNTPVVANYNVTGATVTIGVDNTVNALTFSSSAPLTIQADGQLTVTSGTLAVQTGSSVVSGGVLNTTGNLNKTGTGELDLQSNTNVNGIANVVAGLLSVNGQLNANSVAVDPNATLGGAGVIVASNVVVNGNLAPGNSPGTLNVVGNLVLTGANSTIIEIASPTNFDRIVVTGTATLGGTLNAVGYGGYTIAPGSRFDFLQAGSIVGAYDSIVAPQGLRARFLSSGTIGTLLFGPASYVPMAINQNQRNVAKALDTFIVATNGDRLAVSIALDSLTTAQFPAAFDQIMPGFYESLANIAIEQAFNQTQMLNQRISSVRLGAAGFQAIGGITQPLLHDKNGKSAAEAKDASPIVESATATNWNAWALGTGMFSRTTDLGRLQNYNNDAGGFLVGSDYRWSENFVTGLYAGYDYSYAEYNGGGSTKGNSFSFGTYASYEKDGYYADAVIGGGYTGFQTKRSIEFSTIDRTASANPNSGQFTAGLNLGKDFEVGNFTLGPIVGAQYTYAGIGSFTESGAESLDLSLGQQNANSLRSTLGGRIAYTWNLNQKIALIPEVRMFWQHEFLNNPRNINASLDGGSGASFGYETTDPYRNSVFAGAGVTAQFGKNLTGSVFYNINFGSQTYQSNMVSAGLNFSF